MNKFLKAQSLSPDLPWNNDDPDKLGGVVIDYVRTQEVFVRRWAQRWFENMQFVYGNSAVRWSRRFDFAVDIDLLRPGVNMSQRASTNVARTVLEALSSMIYANMPTWESEACEEGSIKGMRFQKITEKLLDCYGDRLACDELFEEASAIFTGYGQVAYKTDWDSSCGEMVQIPAWKKSKAPVFTDTLMANQVTGGLLSMPVQDKDSQGQPYMQDRWEAVTDVHGRQVINTVLSGSPYIRVLTPLEYRRDINSRGMHDTKFVEEIRVLDYDDWLKEYSVVEGKTKHFDSIVPELQSGATYNFAIRHYMRMQYITPPSYGDGVNQLGGSAAPNILKNKVLVIEHYDMPNQEMWPRGRRLVIANGLCTHITEPSYWIQKSGGWHPFSEAQWLKLPPSSISTGPMDAVTAKNRELNAVDSLISTALRRNLGSVLLYQHGSGFDPQKITGEPGQMQGVANLEGVKWLHDSQAMPASLEALREGYKNDIYESSGAGDALRGERSTGVSSGYALRQIEEREQKRLTQARKNFERGISEVGMKLISCVRSNVVKLDQNIMGYMKRAGAGEFTTDDVVSFLSGPITFGTDIRVKPGSMLIKSKATMQANLMELAQGPAAVRLQDPATMDKFLDYFDAGELRDAAAPHREAANHENDIFNDMLRLGNDAEGIKPPLVLVEDDDQTHMAIHNEFIVKNRDELTSNEFLFKQVHLHIEYHRLAQQEKSGALIPGTKLLAPQMLQQSMAAQPPNAQQVQQAVMANLQQKAMMGQQAGPPPQNGPAPQPDAGGPGQIPTNKPAAKTPAGKSAEQKIAQTSNAGQPS
jgi:hypothetical protein